MSTLFINVLRQAVKTFDRTNQATFNANFNVLKQLTGQLSVDDVLTDQKDFLNDAYFERTHRAPCTFVNIFENDVVSMSIFVLRGNFKMPLHDHPMMYGLLRGIYGELCVQSFTALPPTNIASIERSCSDVNKLSVYAEKPLLVNPNTTCAVLTPYERNFHEITAVGGVAAFFDILSPPYDNNRHCNFYRCLKPINSAAQLQIENDKKPLEEKSVVLLESIPIPTHYYCDTAPTPKLVKQNTLAWTAKFYSAAT